MGRHPTARRRPPGRRRRRCTRACAASCAASSALRCGRQRRVDVAPLERVAREVVVLGRGRRVVVLHVERVGEAQRARSSAGCPGAALRVRIAGGRVRAAVLDQRHVAPARRRLPAQERRPGCGPRRAADRRAGELLERRPQVDVGGHALDRDARAARPARRRPAARGCRGRSTVCLPCEQPPLAHVEAVVGAEHDVGVVRDAEPRAAARGWRRSCSSIACTDCARLRKLRSICAICRRRAARSAATTARLERCGASNSGPRGARSVGERVARRAARA